MGAAECDPLRVAHVKECRTVAWAVVAVVAAGPWPAVAVAVVAPRRGGEVVAAAARGETAGPEAW
jgi:hypothetical protein